MASSVLILSAIALLLASAPIFLALLAGTVVGFEFFGPAMPPVVLAQRLVEGVNVFSILAVPLFVYAADIISRGEIGERLVGSSIPPCCAMGIAAAFPSALF